jgi:PAS domain S-box-containing protein
MSEFDDHAVLRNVIEGLQTGVYVVGKDGKIYFWSDGAQRILGHLKQDILGRALREDLFALGDEPESAFSDALGALSDVFRDGRPVMTLRIEESRFWCNIRRANLRAVRRMRQAATQIPQRRSKSYPASLRAAFRKPFVRRSRPTR